MERKSERLFDYWWPYGSYHLCSIHPQDLVKEFLHPSEIKFYGTPRRLAVLIEGLETKQPDREEEIKGPPITAAFKDGKPTKAAEGFARKQGVSLEDFQIRETKKGEFVFVEKKIKGEETTKILQQLLPQWINGCYSNTVRC